MSVWKKKTNQHTLLGKQSTWQCHVWCIQISDLNGKMVTVNDRRWRWAPDKNLASVSMFICKWRKQYLHNKSLLSFLGPWVVHNGTMKEPITLKNLPTLLCPSSSISHLGNMAAFVGSGVCWCKDWGHSPELEGVHWCTSKTRIDFNLIPLWMPTLTWFLLPDFLKGLLNLCKEPYKILFLDSRVDLCSLQQEDSILLPSLSKTAFVQ